MSDLYGSGARGKATRLHAQLVRARGYCLACSMGWEPMPKESTRLECSHIISRRYASTRTDEMNAYCLCSAHHRRFTEWGKEWAAFIEATIGNQEYERLRWKAEQIKKVDWDAEVERLKGLLAEAEYA